MIGKQGCAQEGHVIQDYIPYTSGAVRKANRTKRERWERLVNDSDAKRMMRGIYRMEKEIWHADNHVRGYTDCCLPQCEFWDAAVAQQAVLARRLLIAEFTHRFCKQFGVTFGYFKRFRSRTIYRDAEDMHEFDRAERFSETDRLTLRNWLAENS